MAQPYVDINKLDNQLGVIPFNGKRPLAYVGTSTQGPIGTSSRFSRVADLVAVYGSGDLVDAAAHGISFHGLQVVVTRIPDVTAGQVSNVVDASAGTSAITVTGAGTQDLDIVVRITANGTVGTSTALEYSLDAGETWTAADIGIANSFTVPNTGTVVHFSAGTLLDGDQVSYRILSPEGDVTGLSAAIDTMVANTANGWRQMLITDPLSAAEIIAVDAKFFGLEAKHKWRQWQGSIRMPNVGETEAAYLTYASGVVSSLALKKGKIHAGDVLLTSGVDGKQTRKPWAWAAAARSASVDEQIDTADVDLGAFPGVSITDENGNTVCHDESLFPGLSDLRLSVARSWDSESFPGVYENDPLLLTAPGSDYARLPDLRVIDLGAETAYPECVRVLSKGLILDKASGKITEAQGRVLDRQVESVLESALLQPGASRKASEVSVKFSRDDNVQSTKIIHADIRILPLGAAKAVIVTLAFSNPAIQQAA